MFIETIPNRGSPPAALLRESYRDREGRSQKRTLANLSKLPRDVVEGLRALLKGGVVIRTGPDGLAIERSLPHGHVATALEVGPIWQCCDRAFCYWIRSGSISSSLSAGLSGGGEVWWGTCMVLRIPRTAPTAIPISGRPTRESPETLDNVPRQLAQINPRCAFASGLRRRGSSRGIAPPAASPDSE